MGFKVLELPVDSISCLDTHHTLNGDVRPPIPLPIRFQLYFRYYLDSCGENLLLLLFFCQGLVCWLFVTKAQLLSMLLRFGHICHNQYTSARHMVLRYTKK